MDYRRARARFLRSLPAALLCLGPLDGTAAPPLSAAKWTVPADRLAVLTSEPAECIGPVPRDAATSFEIGRIAFRTPLLLGGQAARAGLSCASCHRGGRNNPSFAFPGLSATPGTADVTSSVMSSHRGNGVFDPVPIPDLASPGKVSRRGPELQNFIHGLIVEEFDGPEPTARVLDGLTTYVAALTADACPNPATRLINLEQYVDDARRASLAARVAWETGDPATARLMIAGARATLGLIDERFAPPGLETRRRELRDADSGLLAVQHALDRGAPDIGTRITAWNAASEGWIAALRGDAKRSLFNADTVRATIN